MLIKLVLYIIFSTQTPLALPTGALLSDPCWLWAVVPVPPFPSSSPHVTKGACTGSTSPAMTKSNATPFLSTLLLLNLEGFSLPPGFWRQKHVAASFARARALMYHKEIQTQPRFEMFCAALLIRPHRTSQNSPHICKQAENHQDFPSRTPLTSLQAQAQLSAISSPYSNTWIALVASKHCTDFCIKDIFFPIFIAQIFFPPVFWPTFVEILAHSASGEWGTSKMCSHQLLRIKGHLK